QVGLGDGFRRAVRLAVPAALGVALQAQPVDPGPGVAHGWCPFVEWARGQRRGSLVTLALLLSLCAAGGAGKADRDTPVQDARQVVAAVVEAAKANRGRSMPLAGDELMEHYVRAAAAAARKLPEARRGAAFALGLGVAVDPSSLMRKNPVVGATWRRVESDD